jgi:hypothetical protein
MASHKVSGFAFCGGLVVVLLLMAAVYWRASALNPTIIEGGEANTFTNDHYLSLINLDSRLKASSAAIGSILAVLILFFLLRGRHHYMWKLPLIARATQ